MRKVFFGFVALMWAITIFNLHPRWETTTELIIGYLWFSGFWVSGAGQFENINAARFWAWGFIYSGWHLLEQICVFIQRTTHANWFGRTEPTTILGFFIPKIEAHHHLVFNLVVTVLAVAALVIETQEPRYIVDDTASQDQEK